MKYFIDDLKINPRTAVEVSTYIHRRLLNNYNILCTILFVQGVGELLHVATAKGHLDIVKYLIEDCHVDPACVGQVTMQKIYS